MSASHARADTSDAYVDSLSALRPSSSRWGVKPGDIILADYNLVHKAGRFRAKQGSKRSLITCHLSMFIILTVDFLCDFDVCCCDRFVKLWFLSRIFPFHARSGLTRPWGPRRAQDRPRWHQDGSRRPPDASRCTREAPRSLQEASKRPQDASKRPRDASKRPPGPPGDLENALKT